MLRNAFLFTLVATLLCGCSNKNSAKPTIVLVKTNRPTTINCFGQNTELDTLNVKDEKKLKRYFNSMVPAPSRSSLFVKRD
ncbi:hypothetical protein [Algibacter sp. L3A6]|uniref:hypothetical protein n=1 Tax=Algibacter sp. L3A6 TaxID=2686366 RepID=UPI00131D4E58|nr:hypothetical protein [Algibacter sp. L3A6]